MVNLFVTSPHPNECVTALDDARLRVQCKEVIQILHTALHAIGVYESSWMVRPFAPRHPINVWAQEPANMRWTWKYGVATFCHYYERFDKWHAYRDKFSMTSSLMAEVPVFESSSSPSTFCNCASRKDRGLDFTHISDVFEAYRQYLNARWASDHRAPVWSGFAPPEWKTYLG